MKEGKADGVNPNKYPDYQAVVDEVIEYYDSAKAYRDRPIVDVVRELVQ
jgi:hypothetical protein